MSDHRAPSDETPQLFSLFSRIDELIFAHGPEGIAEGDLPDAFSHYLVTLMSNAHYPAQIDAIFSLSLHAQSEDGEAAVMQTIVRSAYPVLIRDVQRGLSTMTSGHRIPVLGFEFSRDGKHWMIAVEVLDTETTIDPGADISAFVAAGGSAVPSADERAAYRDWLEAWLRHDAIYNHDQPCAERR